MTDLPEIGTKVVEHHTHAAPSTGEVVSRDSWELAELPPDTFVVDYSDGEGELMARVTLDEATQMQKVVHIDP